MGKGLKMGYYAIIIGVVVGYIIWLSIDNDIYKSNPTSLGLNFTYILSAIAVIGTVVSSVIHLINNPKSAKSLLIGVGVLAVVCIIGYTLSSGEITDHSINYGVDSVKQSKMIDMGIYLTAFLSVVSVVSILISEGISLFKN